MNDCPSYLNYDTYSQIIRDSSIRRKVINHSEELAKIAFDENKDIYDAISIAVTKLVQHAKPSGGAQHITTYLQELYKEAEERAQDPKDIYGLKTGLFDFDKITRGLQVSEQFILAGSPATGKSLLAFQLACGMAENGHPGAIYELEMSGVAVMRRRVSSMAKITTKDIRSGRDMNERWSDFVKAIEEMERLPIYLTQESNLSTIQLRADLSRLKNQYGIQWYIVDYMDLLADGYGSNEAERSAYISRQLHNITKDLNLAGIAIQSMTKQGFSRSAPSMANVSGSHKVAHDADQIAILTKGTPDNPDELNTVTLTWEKMREDDGSRSIRLIKVPGFPSFESYKAEEEIVVGNWWQK
jgi:replicative DNA helicase